MSYEPTPGSNIAKILTAIPPKKEISYSELKRKLIDTYPDFPADSIYVHTRFLEKKDVLTIQKVDGEKVFKRKIDTPTQNELIPIETKSRPSGWGEKPLCVLKYCQERVGKRVSSRAIREHCGKNVNDTAPLDALKRLRDGGYIQLIPETSPYEYLVMPDIKPLSKIPKVSNKNPTTSVIQPKTPQIEENINKSLANMSISDILQDYVRIQAENQRLKEGLQRMAMEFIHLGIIEEH